MPNVSSFYPFDEHAPGRTVRRFVQELCDLSRCEAMIASYESARRTTFAAVMRLRLDMAWETVLALPRAVPTAAHPSRHVLVNRQGQVLREQVHVPHMGRCQGRVNDKFAFGSRKAMSLYLTRVTQLAAVWPMSGFTISGVWSSELYLRATAMAANYKLNSRPDFMFCQFGDRRGSHADWIGCTARLRLGLRCEKMTCGWCEGGCQCWNRSCTASPAPPQSRCAPTGAPKQPRLCLEFGCNQKWAAGAAAGRAGAAAAPRTGEPELMRKQLSVLPGS
eukprot:1865362-Prymnesium_polylepis.1